MNNQEFYKEIDRLVEKGETTFPEYDIDIEAFHHLKAIKTQSKTSKLINVFTGIILFFAVVVFAIYLLSPENFNFKTAFLNTGKKEMIEREVLFDSILSENVRLKGIVAELESISHESNLEKIEVQPPLKESPPEISNEVTASEEELIYHVVKSGETLFSLAKQYYGSGSMATTLMEDNNISNPSELLVGMTLVIHKR